MIVNRTQLSNRVLLHRRNELRKLELTIAEPLSDGSFWHRDTVLLDHDQVLKFANDLMNILPNLEEEGAEHAAAPADPSQRTLAEMIALHPRARQLLIDAGIISTSDL